MTCSKGGVISNTLPICAVTMLLLTLFASWICLTGPRPTTASRVGHLSGLSSASWRDFWRRSSCSTNCPIRGHGESLTSSTVTSSAAITRFACNASMTSIFSSITITSNCAHSHGNSSTRICFWPMTKTDSYKSLLPSSEVTLGKNLLWSASC